MFELHPQLVEDCVVVTELPLCTVLLLNDSNYPWLILVPRREGVREVFHLEGIDQQQLLVESSAISSAMSDFFKAEKMNVAALGNVVPQLHIHHIVRYTTDLSWPKPVWGAVESKPYSEKNLQQQLNSIKKILNHITL